MTVASLPAQPTAIEIFDPPSLDVSPAEQLRRIKTQAPEFKKFLHDSGTATAFVSRSLIKVPYPTRFALWDASRYKHPYIWFVNRMFVVQWKDNGRTVTMLAEPSDWELGENTPFFDRTRRQVEKIPGNVRGIMVTEYGTVLQQLEKLGIAPETIDYLSFDHLHTQDVRRLIGTNGPAPDLGFHDSPVPGWFPNAKLIVHPSELDHVRDIHPFQSQFHQPDVFSDLPEERLQLVTGDVLLGPGVALMHTPGHTLGNHSIAVNAPGRGIFTSSENGVAVECYFPERARIPGMKRWARDWNVEVVLNFNTPEYASFQYNSMVKEKLVADPIPGTPQMTQVYPSSELTHHWLAPGIRPAFEHGELTLGDLVT